VKGDNGKWYKYDSFSFVWSEQVKTGYIEIRNDQLALHGHLVDFSELVRTQSSECPSGSALDKLTDRYQALMQQRLLVSEGEIIVGYLEEWDKLLEDSESELKRKILRDRQNARSSSDHLNSSKRVKTTQNNHVAIAALCNPEQALTGVLRVPLRFDLRRYLSQVVQLGV
jgi:hypothetical protein